MQIDGATHDTAVADALKARADAMFEATSTLKDAKALLAELAAGKADPADIDKFEASIVVIKGMQSSELTMMYMEDYEAGDDMHRAGRNHYTERFLYNSYQIRIHSGS